MPSLRPGQGVTAQVRRQVHTRSVSWIHGTVGALAGLAWHRDIGSFTMLPSLGAYSMPWSASQYMRFEDERTRPVRDLVAAIPTLEASRILDLGCGPGNSTEVLLARYPDAVITGIDSAEDMLRAARQRLPSVTFELADIATWQATGPWDVIIANAVLHWLNAHEVLLPRLVGALSPRGSLAVQVPDNLSEPSHVLMRQVAVDGPWAARLADALGARSQVAPAAWYYRLLRPHCARVDVWRTTYHHPLAGIDAVVEWFKGSGLRPFLSPLNPEEQAEFLRRYRESLAMAYPLEPDGSVLLPFPRLFFVATS
jgi:trans-aconitate 2-methyltransferase